MVDSVWMERSPGIQLSSPRCSPSSATATRSSPEFPPPPPHADIYISDPTLLFGETQCYVVRVILFVHFWDMTNETSVLLCHRLDALQTGVQVGSGGNNCISLSSSFFSLSSQR